MSAFPSPTSQKLPLTFHASERMKQRAISAEAIELALRYGRMVWTRGALIFAIGRREVHQFMEEGVYLQPFEGVQVVCTPGGTILTAYRNRDFRRLRPGLGRGRHSPRAQVPA